MSDIDKFAREFLLHVAPDARNVVAINISIEVGKAPVVRLTQQFFITDSERLNEIIKNYRLVENSADINT